MKTTKFILATICFLLAGAIGGNGWIEESFAAQYFCFGVSFLLLVFGLWIWSI